MYHRIKFGCNRVSCLANMVETTIIWLIPDLTVLWPWRQQINLCWMTLQLMMMHHYTNSFTAMMSLENNQSNWEIWNWHFCLLFLHRCVKVFSSKLTALKVDRSQDWKMSCLQVCLCIFLPKTFISWGNEGAKFGFKRFSVSGDIVHINIH